MINFLHTFNPEPVLLSIGVFKIYWYGLFIVIGILLGMMTGVKLAEKYRISKDFLIDSVFYAVIAGIIGARIYHVLLELPYYSNNPLAIFKIWEGGLAIHGALIAGIAAILLFAKKRKNDPWVIFALYAPAMALGQAIGRWGNYFNQELYGRPTNLPWGIPIEPVNRQLSHYTAEYFHPAFLYESLGNLLIFILLLLWHRQIIKNKETANPKIIVFAYLIMYSFLRFFTEFIRIDPTPEFFGLRVPQIASLFIIAFAGLYLLKITKKTALEK